MAKNMIATSEESAHLFPTESERITIGIDPGDRYSRCCLLGPDGNVLAEGRVRTTPEAMAIHFEDLPPSRIAIKVRANSRWVSQVLQKWEHEVIVANPRNLPVITSKSVKRIKWTLTCWPVSPVLMRSCFPL